jgi:uncharacterized protein YndB with AHSA1/START domain
MGTGASASAASGSAIVAGLIAIQPSTYPVTRTASIAAPPAVLFAAVNDFHNWPEWSPWQKIDPAMRRAYEGPGAGVGSVFKWSGNDKAGAGEMAIAESVPDQKIAIQLAFTKPYVPASVIDFRFRPEGAGTNVTWPMTGENNFALKAISLFYGMDKLVGPDFERGLAQRKTLAEKP